ncbi:hypothetical protein HMPREF9332_01977 [Alloprevotella rava F0323]|uniref:Chromate transporter n=1 Tax=Alloprevotella rava F0323 TaxID=679199 RepID=G5GEH5_9BACT|nr:chromate transporter [Alloprevotella rava]EHG20857.1 hypothetical protein HMPREF9332_01977 [Alloprevotella rava F0323]
MNSFLKLFVLFLKEAGFALGNGYAAISPLRKKLTATALLTEEEFDNSLAIAQAMPGVFSLNLAVYLGHKICRWKGSIAAALGTLLPAFAILLILTICFNGVQDNKHLAAFLKGLRPGIIAFIVVSVIRMLKSSGIALANIWLLIGTIASIVFLGISPAYIIIAIVLAAILYAVTIRPNE